MGSVNEAVRVILTEVAQGAAKVKAHPDKFYAAIQGGEDAIADHRASWRAYRGCVQHRDR